MLHVMQLKSYSEGEGGEGGVIASLALLE